MSKRELSPDVTVVSEPREPDYLRLLKEGKVKISNAHNWCKGVAFGYTLGNRMKYCMMGSLGDSGRCQLTPVQAEAAMHLYRVLGHQPIVSFNDDPSTTHADVLAAFDLAIEQATKDWLTQR